MTLKENSRYKRHSIYTNRSGENQKVKDPSSETPIMHKQFETRGEYKFGELELGAYGWVRSFPLNQEDRKITMSKLENGVVEREMMNFDEEDYKKTLIFNSEKATAILSLDLKENYHQMDIFLKKQLEDSYNLIEDSKRIFERGLKCKFNEIEPSNLVKKIESN